MINKYKQQMTEKCTNSKCTKIFCRQCDNQTIIDLASEILAEYDTLWLCGNIDCVLENTIPKYHNNILDVYFYIHGLLCTSPVAERSSKMHFSHEKQKEKTKSPKKKSTKDMSEIIIRPSDDLRHDYCVLRNRRLDTTEQYLLVGIIHLLLKKTITQKNFNLSLTIIRLFVLTGTTSFIDAYYYSALFDVFYCVFERMTHRTTPNLVQDAGKCSCKRCLYHFDFSKDDFADSLQAVKHNINRLKLYDLRENPSVKYLLDILNVLYKINEKMGYSEHQGFYLPEFCNNQNLRAEYKYYKMKGRSLFNYPFVMPIYTKAEIIKMENTDTMKTILQDTFFRSLFEGPIDPYLIISVRRNHVYGDSLKIISKIQPEQMRKQLRIQFIGEDGVDSGGIIKEYFQILSNEIIRDVSLFVLKNNRIWFQPGADPDRMKTIGKIVGLALYNDIVINLPFPSLFFKKLLSIQLLFSDFEEIEPVNFNSILNLEQCSVEELESLDLLFTIDYNVNGVHCIKELIPGGDQYKVTASNFKAFKMSYSDFHMNKLIEKEFGAFVDGFQTIIHLESMPHLQPKELEKIIIGVEEFNAETLKSHTVYNGFKRDERIIRDLWSIISEYTLSDKRRFLQFVTGSDRLPVSCERNFKISVIRNGDDSERLPTSQTCFNTLLLPQYSSKEKLQAKLLKAITLATGFYLM